MTYTAQQSTLIDTAVAAVSAWWDAADRRLGIPAVAAAKQHAREAVVAVIEADLPHTAISGRLLPPAPRVYPGLVIIGLIDDPADHAEALRAERAEADRYQSAVLDAMRDHVRDNVQVRGDKARIADLLGVSRPTVDSWLGPHAVV